MRSSTLFSLFTLTAFVLASPVSRLNEPRGLISGTKTAVLDIAGAARLAIYRLHMGEHLTQGLENLSSAGGMSAVTSPQVDALLAAAKRGDARVIDALDNAIFHNHFYKQEISGPLRTRVVPLYRGSVFESPFRRNALHGAVVDVGRFASRQWGSLGWQAQWALATSTAVAASAASLAAALGTGYGVYHAVKSHKDGEYEFPSELTEDDMQALKQYIAAHPERYQGLMSALKEKVTRLTDAQKQELVKLAPPSFINSIPSPTNQQSASSDGTKLD